MRTRFSPVLTSPAQLSTTHVQQRARRSKITQGVVALGLMLALGGYTVAESMTQDATAVARQSAIVRADQTRADVAAERERAVAAARNAVADATAVQTVAAGSLSAAELAPLTAAVAELTTMVDAVPTSPAAIGSSAAGGAAGGAVGATDLTGVERASRGVARAPIPAAGAGVLAAAPDPATPDPATSDPNALADAFAASDAARAAAESLITQPATTSSPTPSPAPSSSATSDGAAPDDASPDDAAPDDEMAAGILAAAAHVADLTAQVKTTAQANIETAQTAAASAAQAEAAAAAAATKADQRASLSAYANGRVPAEALCAIGFASSHQLRCDAADALDRLNASYRVTFGSDLTVTDSYRSYAAQVACARTKGRLCATPGTSNHGRGVAVDLGSGVQSFGSKQHGWMADHAGEFGWVLPQWASQSGSKSEPWHWEFTG